MRPACVGGGGAHYCANHDDGDLDPARDLALAPPPLGPDVRHVCAERVRKPDGR